MSCSRRRFLSIGAAGLSPLVLGRAETAPRIRQASPGGFEPWIEVDSQALLSNVGTLRSLAGGRPIIAVIKNNGYGLGLREVGRSLAADRRISALGVVKVSEALALREAGVRSPILLLAHFDEHEGEALARQDVTLTLGVPDAAERATRAAARARRPVRAQVYVDTGMSRMGLPYHSAAPLIGRMARSPQLELGGMFTELTEDREFDTEQVRRLKTLAAAVAADGVRVGGPLHAASSHALFNHRDTLLDAVRPGIALFGAYPSDDGSERAIATLQVAVSLKARVVRVEPLRAGDTVSYGRRFRAESPAWIATIPMGHADGYPRRAVNGAQVLIGGRTYPVIGAVSASHTIVLLGPETTVKVGDVVTLIGPQHPEVHPNAIAIAAGVSVYDVLMHLNPSLPRAVRSG